MTTAYVVVIDNNKFLMVFNPRRNGWEMPGGHIENNETPEEGALRELMEESGYSAKIIGHINIESCDVFACIPTSKRENSEMKSKFFENLPENLSFDTDEYEDVIMWAKEVVNTYNKKGRAGQV